MVYLVSRSVPLHLGKASLTALLLIFTARLGTTLIIQLNMPEGFLGL